MPINAKQVQGLNDPASILIRDDRFNASDGGWSGDFLKDVFGIPGDPHVAITLAGGKLTVEQLNDFGVPNGPPGIVYNTAGPLGGLPEFGGIAIEASVQFDTSTVTSSSGLINQVGPGFWGGAGNGVAAMIQGQEDGSGNFNLYLVYGVLGAPVPLTAVDLGINVAPASLPVQKVRLQLVQISDTEYELSAFVDGILQGRLTSIMADIAIDAALDPILLSGAGQAFSEPHEHSFLDVKIWNLGAPAFAPEVTLPDTDIVGFSEFSATDYPSLWDGETIGASGNGSTEIFAANNHRFNTTGTSFSTSGDAKVGDVLVIKNGYHRGRYEVLAVVDDDTLQIQTLDGDDEPWYHDESSLDWGIETSGDITSTTVFTDLTNGVDFSAAGVVAGDLLIIKTGTQQGVYEIDSGGVTSTALTVRSNSGSVTAVNDDNGSAAMESAGHGLSVGDVVIGSGFGVSQYNVELVVIDVLNDDEFVVDVNYNGNSTGSFALKKFDGGAEAGLQYDIAPAASRNPTGWTAGSKVDLVAAGGVMYTVVKAVGSGGIASFGDGSVLDFASTPVPPAYVIDIDLVAPPAPASGNIYLSTLVSAGSGFTYRGLEKQSSDPVGQVRLFSLGSGRTGLANAGTNGGFILNARENGQAAIKLTVEVFMLDASNEDQRIHYRLYVNGVLGLAGYDDAFSFGTAGLPSLSALLNLNPAQSAIWAISRYVIRKVPLSAVLRDKTVPGTPNALHSVDAPATTSIVFPAAFAGYSGEVLVDTSKTLPVRWRWVGGRSVHDTNPAFQLKDNIGSEALDDAVIGDVTVTDTNPGGEGVLVGGTTFQDQGYDFVSAGVVPGTAGQGDGSWLWIKTGPNAGQVRQIISIFTTTSTIVSVTLSGSALTVDGGAYDYEILSPGTTLRAAAGSFTTGHPVGGGAVTGLPLEVVIYTANLGSRPGPFTVASVTSATELELNRKIRFVTFSAAYAILASTPGRWVAEGECAIDAITADRRVPEDVSRINADSTGGAIDIQLQASQESMVDRVLVKDVGGAAATNNITVNVDDPGTEDIDGATSYVIQSDYGAVELRRRPDNSGWDTV